MSAPVREAPRSLRSARRAGLIDQVIDQLRGQISSGAWPVGDRIPTETELSQLTATSRNTVREAVQSLVHAGLLERRQGSGTYVLAASELAGAVSRRVADASSLDVLEVRRSLEVGAARLAATRRTPADIAHLRDLLAARQAAWREHDLDALVTHDVQLHRAIVRASHNPVLIDLYDNLVGALQENVRRNVAAIAPQDNDHAPLIDAVIAGDVQVAVTEAGAFLDALIANNEPETVINLDAARTD